MVTLGFVATLGLVIFLFWKRLKIKAPQAEKACRQVLSSDDVKNLKIMLLPLAGGIFGLTSLFIYGIGEDDYFTASVVGFITTLVFGGLAWLYITMCNKAVQDFTEYGKKLLIVIVIYLVVAILTVLLSLVGLLFAFGCNNPLVYIIIVGCFIPIGTNFPAIYKVFQIALNPQPDCSETIPSPAMATSQAIRCPYCGEYVPSDTTTCPHCEENLR